MTIRRASLALGICASIAIATSAVAAPVPPAPPAPPPVAAAKVSDIGCTARLLWFINVGRDMAKDTTRPDKDRVSMFQTVELLRGALGYFEARIEALPPANRSAEFVSEVGLVDKMTPAQRASEITTCLTTYTTAEQRVLSSLDPKK